MFKKSNSSSKVRSEESKKKERAYLLNQQKIIRVHF